MKMQRIFRSIGIIIIIEILIILLVMTPIGYCRPQSSTKKADEQRNDTRCGACSSTESYRPVCGSDGRTYANACELRRVNCAGVAVLLRHDGPCQSLSSLSLSSPGRCATQRLEAERKLRQSSSRSSGSSDVIHVPQCEKDGTYSEVQCHANSNYCWCVDPSSGQPVPGSSSVRWRKPKCKSSPSTSNNQLLTRVGLKATTKRGGGNKKNQAKQGCKKSEQATFNRNLAKYILSEYKQMLAGQQPTLSAASTAEPELLEKRAIEWKFTELDKNRNNWLEKKEMKALRRKVRRTVKPGECGRRLSKVCDTDRNQRISHGEWIVCLGVGMNISFRLFLSLNSEEQTDVSGLINHRPDSKLPSHNDDSSSSRWDTELRTVEDKSFGLDEEDPLDCFTERQNALEQQRSSQHNIYIPECSLDGKYAQIQCYKSTVYCWCVDRETGKPIPSTAVRNTKPDCEKLIRANKQIKGCPNRKKAEFITEFVDYLWREMSSELSNWNESSVPDREKQVDALTRWKFDKLDKNLNRVLDKNEWREFRKELKKRKSVRKCGRSFLKFCDASNDRVISHEEWVECFSILKESSNDGGKRKQKGQNPLDKYLKND